MNCRNCRQANVALNLQPKPSEKDEKEEEQKEDAPRKPSEPTTSSANVASSSNMSQSIINVLKEEKKKEEPSTSFSGEGHRLNEESPKVTAGTSGQSSGTGVGNSNEVERMEISSPEPTGLPEEDDEDMGEIHIVSSSDFNRQHFATKNNLIEFNFISLSHSIIFFLIPAVR